MPISCGNVQISEKFSIDRGKSTTEGVHEKSLDIPLLRSVNFIEMFKKLILFPAIALVLLSTQACYTQLAWFHPPEPKENQPTFSEYDPYGLEGLERSSNFEPYPRSLYRGRHHYSNDPSFWSFYGDYGSPFGLYSPYSVYGGGRSISPYGYTYYPYDVQGYDYGLTTPVIGNIKAQTPRAWDRNSSKTSSNLIIRRELSLSVVTAQPIKMQPPVPQRSFLISESQRRWDASNGNYDNPSYRGNKSSATWSRGSSYPSGRSISSGTSSGSSSSRSSSSSGRVTRRR